MELGVIADDLTGAMDTGSQFARFGLLSRLSLARQETYSSEVEIINTDTRESCSSQRAAERVRAAVVALEGRLLYKKIDSTLRGHLSAEITTVLAASAYRRALVCPTVIEEGRRVIGGQLSVDGHPLHRSEFAHDPTWPARTSGIADRLREPVGHLSLALVRAGKDTLTQAIEASDERLLIADAAEEHDLKHIAEAIVATRVLPCGALSLARAWVTALTDREPDSQLSVISLHDPIMIVSASRHPRTRTQMEALKQQHSALEVIIQPDTESSLATPLSRLRQWAQSGHAILLRTQEEDVRSEAKKAAMLRGLAALVAAMVKEHNIGGIVVSGGETAAVVLEALEAESVLIRGEVSPGFSYGSVEKGLSTGLPIFTKAGGFGADDALSTLLTQITGSR